METNEVKELTPTEEILEIICSGQSDQQIRDALDDYHENDIADVLPLIDKETRERLYRILGVERLSEVFTYIDDVSEYLMSCRSRKQRMSWKTWTPMTRLMHWKTSRMRIRDSS